ncbi:MAG: hypothetical protein DRH26_01040 [Deltaproteobacteria bacterium]|nr:MAG: hypothetical protein DRH26_01040 [Deltaproteobacteria bacterium]
MDWKDVGSWLKDNAGTGTALVGSLLTGNLPGAIASGVALVTGATGQANPDAVLASLQNDPATMIRLKELAIQDEENIRNHVREMTKLQLEDEQKSHETTQLTIRSGDNAEDRLVRWTRPLQSWTSLIFAGIYVWKSVSIDVAVLGFLLTLPFTYAGLREAGKWGSGKHQAMALIGGKK